MHPTDLESSSNVLRISKNNILVPVNSDVLRSVSTYFERFFGATRQGAVLPIDDPFHFKSSNFEKCMKIVHGVNLEPITDFEDIKECLLISDEFDLPHVQRMCQKYLTGIQCNNVDKYLFSVKCGLGVEQWKRTVTRKCMDDWLKEPFRNGGVNMVTFMGDHLTTVLWIMGNSGPEQILKMLPSEICRESVDRSTRTGVSRMDAVLESNGVEIPVKKDLLDAVSPVFKEAFDTRGEPEYLRKDGSRVTALKIDEKFDSNALLTCMEIVHGCRDTIDKSSLETLEQLMLVAKHFKLPFVEEILADHLQRGSNMDVLIRQENKLDVYLFACKHDLCDAVKMAIVEEGVYLRDMQKWLNKHYSGHIPHTLNTSDVKRLLGSVRTSEYDYVF